MYPEMLKEADIEPAAAGSLDKVDGTELPKFTFKVPLMPTVDLGTYQDVRLPYEFSPPGAEKLDQTLEEFPQMYGTTETVEREVGDGDYLLVDLKSDQEILTRSGFAPRVGCDSRANELHLPAIPHHLLGLAPTA